MRVIIQKPDLDTCLTALILGVSERDDIAVVMGQTSESDLNDPDVYCIEAGGSGQVHLNNFDHHDPEHYNPPACRQAFVARGPADAGRSRLVDYVCMVDERLSDLPHIPFPSLSSIFSGMLFFETSTLRQFHCGVALLKRVLEDDVDPFGKMPELEEWRNYLAAKEENNKKLGAVLNSAIFFQSRSGKTIALGESDVIGDFDALYRQGCAVVVLLNNAFGEKALRKFAISSKTIKVKSLLLKHLDHMESGWGGHETIICSPLDKSSKLSKEQIIELIKEHL